MAFGYANAALNQDRRVLSRYHRYIGSSGRSKAAEAEAMGTVLTKNLHRKGHMANGERDRTKTWSMSSSGTCPRRQQFTFLGMPQVPITPSRQNIFENGDFLHLRYQVVGLVDGFLTDVEVPLEYGSQTRGTADGITEWEEVLEIKSINERGFSGVKEFGPKPEHVRQATGYMMTTGLRAARFVYENKNNNDNLEFKVDYDQSIADDILREWDMLDGYVARQHLADILPACQHRRGFDYNYCDYNHICLETTTWPRTKPRIIRLSD